jgi:hypothetical protein
MELHGHDGLVLRYQRFLLWVEVWAGCLECEYEIPLGWVLSIRRKNGKTKQEPSAGPTGHSQ